MLEHSVLLLYASEDDWAEHHEPLDDMPLSHASTIEALEEAGEVGRTTTLSSSVTLSNASKES